MDCFKSNYKKIDLYKMYPCSFKDFVIRELKSIDASS